MNSDDQGFTHLILIKNLVGSQITDGEMLHNCNLVFIL